ncbi:unnamed protein product [Soboliphyme baturini]|uniref:Uncharacterized protein n=1 Tax=Soboliphyme baturini TaxID=241478 RepID=A0A183ITV0_9BILA|nr:unnamed protein product [Soboliphyme baturini]
MSEELANMPMCKNVDILRHSTANPVLFQRANIAFWYLGGYIVHHLQRILDVSHDWRTGLVDDGDDCERTETTAQASSQPAMLWCQLPQNESAAAAPTINPFDETSEEENDEEE